MFDKPKTKEEAFKIIYGQWSGNPKGNHYLPSRCACAVWDNWIERQCSRKPGFGPDKLYCKQHAKEFK